MSTEKVEAQIFAQIIKSEREKRGWTRYQLAKNAHMDEAHIMRIEQGAYCVRIDIVNKLCNALGIDITFPI